MTAPQGRKTPISDYPPQGRFAAYRYSAAEIDFLAAYVFAEDIWYIFPVPVIEKHKAVEVRPPGSKRSRYEKYHEAWKLMVPASAEPSGDGDAEDAAMPPAAASATAT